MSSKYPEWLNEYQKVSQKQQDYLGKIHALRRSLQNKDDQLMMVAVERQRLLPGRRRNPRCPAFNRMPARVMHFGPEPFPNRANMVQDRNRFYMAPTPMPRKLPPIIKGKQIMESGEELSYGVQDKDHASIDIIAERNRITGSGNGFYAMSRTPSPIKRATDRQTLNISRVALHNKDMHVYTPLFFSLPMEYITDISSRKTVFSSGKQG